jgi:hypothetical protein
MAAADPLTTVKRRLILGPLATTPNQRASLTRRQKPSAIISGKLEPEGAGDRRVLIINRRSVRYQRGELV